MDSSKILEEECSSSESGWTMYIASSPDEEHDRGENEDDEVVITGEQGCKKESEDFDSDDSMASDASSGPSDHVHGRPFGYHAGKRDERSVGKKNNHQDEKKKHHENKVKVEKDKSGLRANSGGRSKKI